MSGINTGNYERQLTQLGTDVTNIEAEIQKLELANQDVATTYKNTKAKYAETLDWANKSGFKDPNGKVLQFKSLQEFDDLCAKGTVWNANGTPINKDGFWFTDAHKFNEEFKAAEIAYNKVMGPTLDKLKEAQEKLEVIGGGLKESIESLKGIAKLLESGDIQGSMMLLQTTRSSGLEKQLNTQIGALQMRNARITELNGQLTLAQKALAGDEKNTTKIEAVGNLKTQIDSLNSTSQLDMVRMQGLVNKRNEAFDLLTNLLSKFQKTVDGIVGNMR